MRGRRWAHPRITPYRLVFLLTTAGLGIAKAVLVSRDDAPASTTVEWIAGVVVALVFQFSDSYEHNGRRPPYVDWFFSYDCIGRPRLPLLPVTVEDQADLKGHSESPPVVTVYRLLVSALSVAFGLTKMSCGYLGLSTAMNTLDWLVAVPLTLILYYVGLHEDNRSRTPRMLFDVDYSAQVRLLLQKGRIPAFFLCGMVICGVWLKFWLSTAGKTAVVDFPSAMKTQHPHHLPARPIGPQLYFYESVACG